MSNVVQSYNAGAWTALTKMAERGARKDTILAVAEDIGITVDDMDDADRAVMTQKFGEPFGTPEKATLSEDEIAKVRLKGSHMDDWSLLKAICHAANNNDQDALSKLIVDNDFEAKPNAQDAALIGFSLTTKNILANPNAAKKLAGFKPHDSWGFASHFRHDYIREIIKEILCDD